MRTSKEQVSSEGEARGGGHVAVPLHRPIKGGTVGCESGELHLEERGMKCAQSGKFSSSLVGTTDGRNLDGG